MIEKREEFDHLLHVNSGKLHSEYDSGVYLLANIMNWTYIQIIIHKMIVLVFFGPIQKYIAVMTKD